MLNILAFLVLIYIVSIFFSPFPYWKTYFILWRVLLFDKNKAINRKARIKQSRFLIKYFLLCPLWTFLWYLDEIFFPGYKKMTISPVFITGQPRSGTTFLHRTLAADKENFVAVRHIEWRFPYICVQKFLARFKWVDRIAQKNYWPESAAGQVAAKMHPNKLSDWEEDGIFFEECFLHHFFIFLRFPYPQLLQYLDEFQLLPEKSAKRMIETHRKVIRKILYLSDGIKKFYLSKEVTSHSKIPLLLELYPEAKFIVSVRYSAEFMNSLLSLVKFSTMSKTGIDPMDIPEWERIFLNRMKKDSAMLLDLCDSTIKRDKQVRVMFSRFTEDVVHSIEYIYKQLGFKISQAYIEYLQHLHKSQKERDRGYSYEKNSLSGFDEFDEFVKKTDQEFSHSVFETE